MEKQWFDIPLTDKELKSRVKEIIIENANSKYPMEEDSFVRLTIVEDVIGLTPTSEKAVRNSEIERVMRIYSEIKAEE